MKKIAFLILFISFWLMGNAADANWRIHPIFDEVVEHVVETPDYVYFTSRNLTEQSPDEIFSSLFRYDKKGEELMSLSSGNILNGNNVRNIIYNPVKGYLFVLYHDYNIDLIYNNGSVINIPAYAKTNLMYSKQVNGIAVDPDKDRLYLATDFGYVSLNDKKYEVAESRLYGDEFKSFCRLGEDYFVLKDNTLLKGSVSSPRLSIDEYETVAYFNNPTALHPLGKNLCLLISGSKEQSNISVLSISPEGVKSEDLFGGRLYNIENNPKGITIAMDNRLYQFSSDGTYTFIERPEGYSNSAASSLNMAEVWNGEKRKGISSVKKTGETWSVTHDWMAPNAPAPFVTTSFANHPSLGTLLLSYGCLPSTFQMYSYSPYQLSSYKQGRWKNHSTSYNYPEKTSLMTASNGIVIDPDNNNYAYISTYHNGFSRINFNDPRDIIHIARTKDADAGNEGYVALDFLYNSDFASVGAPNFDAQGNLWMLFANGNDKEDPNPHYICWLAEDRKATKSATDIRLPKHVEFDFYAPYSNLFLSVPLFKTGKGLHVYTVMEGGVTYLALLDTNGTPTDMTDDKVYGFDRFHDSDGNEVSLGRVNQVWEDPNTGLVWLCHINGVCYFQPSQVIGGNYYLNKVKVPRNDGTNLADYLLDGVYVTSIATDADGRKWFGTNGGGVICTSSDGREILEEFTTSNSLLPDDVVYGIGYNKEDNTMIFSTQKGYGEYSLPVSVEHVAKADVRAFPNPVRPEYSGYVTITDIPLGSFVKITDSYGHLVKELGIMSGFEILWDISDANFNRVKSGVYHIMVSPSDENSSYSAVGKILVVS